jgi:hypothetical protein
MIFFYLITILYGSTSLPLSMISTNSSVKGLLEQVKDDPKKFIASVQTLDPGAVAEIIALLRGLNADSQGREQKLVDDLNARHSALNTAATNVAEAEDAVTAAIEAVRVAQEAVDDKNRILQIKQQEQQAAEQDLDQKKSVHAQKSAEKDHSQAVHDDEIQGLNDEQRVLADVIEMLQGVHDQYSLVNVALGKTVTLSSMGWNGVGSRAVDGNGGGGVYGSQSCSHTLDKASSIVVDLGRSYDIVSFKFTGRVNECGCESQCTNWQVSVGDSPSGNPVCKSDFDFYGGAVTGLTCDDDQPRSGRYVEMTSSRWMVLCEVEVYAHVRS